LFPNGEHCLTDPSVRSAAAAAAAAASAAAATAFCFDTQILPALVVK